MESCRETLKQLEELEKTQGARADAVDAQLGYLFNNAAVLCLLKEGQVEYPRPSEAELDRHRIRYAVLEDGSVEVRTDGGQQEADVNTDKLYRDDEGYLLFP